MLAAEAETALVSRVVHLVFTAGRLPFIPAPYSEMHARYVL